MKENQIKCDFCIVGGGIAGICAALAAARGGLKTVLIHDRPVLGGNASSEVRMWICGAHGENTHETGIIEELLLENLHSNPDCNFSIWDSVLYGKVRFQKNLTLLLNTYCTSARAVDGKVQSVIAYEMNAETRHTVIARYFADCSGDGVLAPMTGAEFRIGRESRNEFGESIAPDVADAKTMGMSCLIQARETASPHSFTAPAWARKYHDFSEFPNRGSLNPDAQFQNYWWIETGGSGDVLHDAAKNRDELLKVCLGVWHLIKNHPETCEKYRNWELEWIGFLPGKRESRRYVGDVVMNQNDVARGVGNFPDVVAYGGWSMDDHHPDGMAYPGPPTVYHTAPSPYGIPYRSLYSKNITNLFCAGRDISVTHSALSSTRVMATCGTLGHAVGCAVVIAARENIFTRDVYLKYIDELQQTLMQQDAWIPGLKFRTSAAVVAANLVSSNGVSPEALRSGVNRAIKGEMPPWTAKPGDSVTYEWSGSRRVKTARVVLDSDFAHRCHNIIAMRKLDFSSYKLPMTMAESLRFEILVAGEWKMISEISDIADRLVSIPIDMECSGIKLTVLATRGASEISVFAFDFE